MQHLQASAPLTGLATRTDTERRSYQIPHYLYLFCLKLTSLLYYNPLFTKHSIIIFVELLYFPSNCFLPLAQFLSFSCSFFQSLLHLSGCVLCAMLILLRCVRGSGRTHAGALTCFSSRSSLKSHWCACLELD